MADVEWLLKTGESPEMIPARLGTTTPALARWLYRIGRPDLGHIWSAMARREARRRNP